MKVRWREHEFIIVAVVSLVSIGGYLWNMFSLETSQIRSLYAGAYIDRGLSFNAYLNILFPQIAQVLLLSGCYFAIMTVIVPNLTNPLQSQHARPFSYRKAVSTVLLAVVISFILALTMNVLSYYAHPEFYNYGGAGFHILAMFGYNDQPLQNLFSGFDRAMALVALAIAWGCIREIVIMYIKKHSERTAYRTYVINQITFLMALCIILLFTLRTIDSNFDNRDPFATILILFIPSSAITFIINIYWIFPSSDHTHRGIPRTILLLLLSTFLSVFAFALIIRHHIPSSVYLLGWWLFEFVIISPISFFIYQLQKDKILQLRNVHRALTQSKADLQFLRSQINPHFLFNALNTLYGTALLEKSSRTAEGIQTLGDMMRFMLHQNNLDFIPMQSEIQYLKNYISLQKLRTSASAAVNIESILGDSDCDHQIAPMLLIPLVENAFKHGISLSDKSWVRIKLDCDPDRIYFEVRNSIHSSGGMDPERDKSGIGLHNVRERLKALYNDRYTFHCAAVGNEFVAQLSLSPTMK